MNKKNRLPSLVFFGTPLFASHCLESLLDANFKILSVVTAPDRKAGRGKKLTSSSVKQLAESFELPIFQPINLKESKFINKIFVTTDGEKIAKISKSYGAEVIKRPKKLSGDKLGIELVVVHAVGEIEKRINFIFTGMLLSFLIAWILTGDILVGASIGSIEAIAKIFLYYFHERIWTNINFN